MYLLQFMRVASSFTPPLPSASLPWLTSAISGALAFGGAAASFSYDGLGRRSGKTVGGAATFAYDGLNVVQELTGGTPRANLLTGQGLDETYSRTDTTQGTRSFVTDAQGSTLALTDGTSAIKTSYAYEPYGAVSASGDWRGLTTWRIS